MVVVKMIMLNVIYALTLYECNTVATNVSQIKSYLPSTNYNSLQRKSFINFIFAFNSM